MIGIQKVKMPSESTERELSFDSQNVGWKIKTIFFSNSWPIPKIMLEHLSGGVSMKRRKRKGGGGEKRGGKK